MVEYVPEEKFDETVKEGFWIADFYTDHCGPCKMLDLVIDEILYDNPIINLAKCDIEKSPAYAERFEISGTPTLLFYNEGELKGRMVGAMDRATVEEYITSALYGE